jgi:hypothetical protein
MMNENDDNPLKEAVETIRKQAYAEGYQAAVAAMSAALSDLSQNVPAGVSGAIPTVTKQVANAPTVGTIPHYVWQAVARRPGMTNSELISVVQEQAPKASEAVIRTSMGRVKRDYKLIVSRHGKWFPA